MAHAVKSGSFQSAVGLVVSRRRCWLAVLLGRVFCTVCVTAALASRLPNTSGMDPDDYDAWLGVEEPAPPVAVVKAKVAPLAVPAPLVVGPPPLERAPCRDQLRVLLKLDGKTGKPVTVNTAAAQEVRVTRAGNGLAAKAGRFVEAMLDEINVAHGLDLYPLTFGDLCSHIAPGRELLAAAKKVRQHSILADVQQATINLSGKAFTQDLLGLLTQKHEAGQLTPAEVAAIAGVSTSHVRHSRQQANKGVQGALYKLNRNPHPSKRTPYPELEVEAVKRWMGEKNPARSGDSKVIFWMLQNAEDFFHDHYRSVRGQVHYPCNPTRSMRAQLVPVSLPPVPHRSKYLRSRCSC